MEKHKYQLPHWQNDSKALKILKTWLRAVQIPFRVGTVTESDVVVKSRAGQEVGVSIREGGKIAALYMNATDLTHRSVKRAVAAFANLQTELGYKPQSPVNRGEGPEGKAHYADEPELVMLKHTELRRAPNPTPEQLRQYVPTVDKATWRFLRSNSQLCADNMYGFDDLKIYAMMWTVNYIGLYEIDGADENENEKLLFSYLSQRFTGELRGTLLKKQRSVLPMLDEAFIGTRGRTYDYGNKAAWEGEEVVLEDGDDREYVSRHCHLDTTTSSTRKASAAKLLLEQLGNLPHDSLVEVLQTAAGNDRIDMDARKEAARRLKEHVVQCQDCRHLKLSELASGCGIETPSNVKIADEEGNVYENAAEAAKKLGLVASNIRSVLSGKYTHTGGRKFTYVALPEEDEQSTGTHAPS